MTVLSASLLLGILLPSIEAVLSLLGSTIGMVRVGLSGVLPLVVLLELCKAMAHDENGLLTGRGRRRSRGEPRPRRDMTSAGLS